MGAAPLRREAAVLHAALTRSAVPPVSEPLAGRLGCPDCWRTFEPQLRELVRRLHGSTFHVGERYLPAGAADQNGAEQLRLLRDQLRAAVEQENFELAAELRDRLRAME